MSNSNTSVPYLYCPARNTAGDLESCRECRYHEAEAVLTGPDGRKLDYVVCRQHGAEQAAPVLSPTAAAAAVGSIPLDLPVRVRDLDAGGHLGCRAVELTGERLVLDCLDNEVLSPGAHVQMRVVLPQRPADCPMDWVFGGRAVRFTGSGGPHRLEVQLRRGSAAFVRALAELYARTAAGGKE